MKMGHCAQLGSTVALRGQLQIFVAYLATSNQEIELWTAAVTGDEEAHLLIRDAKVTSSISVSGTKN
jgi:hypothetical protein